MKHGPFCTLLKRERCVGVGGSDWYHYSDRDTCRNCGARCDCARIGEIRSALGDEIWTFNQRSTGFFENPEEDRARKAALLAAEKTVRGEKP